MQRKVSDMDTPTMITMDLRTFEELCASPDELQPYVGELTDWEDKEAVSLSFMVNKLMDLLLL